MRHTSSQLKKKFSNNLKTIIYNSRKDSNTLKMCNRNWEKFDKIWVKYNNEQATYSEWENAMYKWLNSEQI